MVLARLNIQKMKWALMTAFLRHVAAVHFDHLFLSPKAKLALLSSPSCDIIFVLKKKKKHFHQNVDKNREPFFPKRMSVPRFEEITSCLWLYKSIGAQLLISANLFTTATSSDTNRCIHSQFKHRCRVQYFGTEKS